MGCTVHALTLYMYMYMYMYHNYVYENSVGLSSTTDPKPKGQPSHCLLRQTYVISAKGRSSHS